MLFLIIFHIYVIWYVFYLDIYGRYAVIWDEMGELCRIWGFLYFLYFVCRY